MGRPRKKKISKSSSPRARYKPKKKSKNSKRGADKVVEKLPSGPPRKPRKSSRSKSAKDADLQRLQKVLAGAGFGSRRECENFIIEGRVEVDGEVAALGATVDPLKQEIRMDGDVLPRFKPIYYLVNKPSGVLSTNKDPAGRMRVIDLVPPGTRLFTVGRLDKASEGLMLVTNDGELANRLAHPRYGVEKTYQVIVAGHPNGEALKTLRHGIHLAEGVVRVARLSVKKKLKQSTQLEMVLTEGRNREIRRMAAYIDHKVVSLKRIGLGTLRLGTMPTGAYRPLTEPELKRLRALCSGQGKPKAAGRPRRAASSRSASKDAPRKPKASKTETTRPRGKQSKESSGSRGRPVKKKAKVAADSSRGRGKASGGKSTLRGKASKKGQKKKGPKKLGQKSKGPKPKARSKSKR